MMPGRYVRLTIADTGTGMSPETQERIFEPFFTTKERDRGTGLGLATVYGIVKQSGGFIWVTSELGVGTSFEIYFPAVNAAAELLRPVSRPDVIVGGSETVLVAEDDDGVRRLAHRALTHHGYRVIEACDGEEALQMARADRRGDIQLLVTDVVMPGLSGHQLASRLTAERPDMRVLYISGYAEHATLKAALSDGAPLLAKPFLPVDLLQSVREILDQPVG
jgi:two-component system, cell cycle sensor histidine kinase and response regulator CckA